MRSCFGAVARSQAPEWFERKAHSWHRLPVPGSECLTLLAGARSDAGSNSQKQQWVQEGSKWHMAGGSLSRGGSAAGPMSHGHAEPDEASELRKRVSDLAGVEASWHNY